MGSVFKAFTVAMAWTTESSSWKTVTTSRRRSANVGGFRIVDKYAKRKAPMPPFPEIFIRSSNTGAARIALDVGGYRQREFLERLGMLPRWKPNFPPQPNRNYRRFGASRPR